MSSCSDEDFVSPMKRPRINNSGENQPFVNSQENRDVSDNSQSNENEKKDNDVERSECYSDVDEDDGDDTDFNDDDEDEVGFIAAGEQNELGVIEEVGLLEPISYGRAYVEVAVELINRGLIQYAQAPVPEITVCPTSTMFNDILQGNEILGRCFLSAGRSRSVELSLRNRPRLESIQVALRNARLGPYGLCVWINVREAPLYYGYSVTQTRYAPHCLHHELVGFIFEDGEDSYGSVVRRSTETWMFSSAHGELRGITSREAMNLLLGRRLVSLLYIVKEHKFFSPVPIRQTRVISIKRPVARVIDSIYRNPTFTPITNTEQVPLNSVLVGARSSLNSCQLVACRLLGLDITTRRDLKFTATQVTSLKEMIGSADEGLDDGSHNFIRFHKGKFEVRTKLADGRHRHTRSICERCFTTTGRNCKEKFCFAHLPEDGSAGDYKVFFYTDSPFQESTMYLDSVAGLPVNLPKGFQEVVKTISVRSLEGFDCAYFQASVLRFLRNVFDEVDNTPRTLLWHQRYSRMPTAAPDCASQLEALLCFLGLHIELGEEQPFEWTFEKAHSTAIIFPPPNMRDSQLPHIYSRVSGHNEILNYVYVGKSFARKGRQLCDDRLMLPSHIKDTLVVQPVVPKLLETIESAAQLAYAIASILKVPKHGKKFIVRNLYLENFTVLVGNTAYTEYVQAIFHREFGRKLIIRSTQ